MSSYKRVVSKEWNITEDIIFINGQYVPSKTLSKRAQDNIYKEILEKGHVLANEIYRQKDRDDYKWHG